MPSLVVYAGLILGLMGLVSLVRPLRSLRVRTRARAWQVVGGGLVLFLAGALWPAPLQRADPPAVQMDEFIPEWQFNEVHSIRIRASTAEVWEAMRAVTAREIRLFLLLTWLRSPRFGVTEESILHPGADDPILDVALRTSFRLLAEERKRELVVATIVCCRPPPPLATPQDFADLRAPGYAKAVMNFRMRDEGGGWTRLDTETRIFATDASSRRRFGVYWRVIYPGSALIRRMWLQAIRRRAEAGG